MTKITIEKAESRRRRDREEALEGFAADIRSCVKLWKGRLTDDELVFKRPEMNLISSYELQWKCVFKVYKVVTGFIRRKIEGRPVIEIGIFYSPSERRVQAKLMDDKYVKFAEGMIEDLIDVLALGEECEAKIVLY